MDIQTKIINCGDTAVIFAIRDGKTSVALSPSSLVDKINVDKIIGKEGDGVSSTVFPAVNFGFADDEAERTFINGDVCVNSHTSVSAVFENQEIVEDKDKKEIITTFSCDGAKTKLYISYKKDSEVLTFWTTVICGEKRRKLAYLSSVCLSAISPFGDRVDSEKLIVHELTNTWAIESRLLSHTASSLGLFDGWIPYGVKHYGLRTVGSMPALGHIPFVAVEDKENDVCWAMQYEAKDSWNIDLMYQNKRLALTAGGADKRNGWFFALEPFEEYTSAQTSVVCCKGGLLSACARLTKSLYSRLTPTEAGDEIPIFFNEYLYSWGAPTMEKIKPLLDVVSSLGVKYFVMDAGWYKKEKDSWAIIGDWNVSSSAFPNGLAEYSEEVRSHGMIPGIWFEFEGVSSQSELAHSHPDWLLTQNGKIYTKDDRHFLDFRKKEVISYLTQKVINTLKDNRIGYIKIDYNEVIDGYIDGEKSGAENLHEHIEAVASFFELIKKEVKGIALEVCSSGGMRHSYGFLPLGAQASFSDVHFDLEGASVACGLHRVMPPALMQIWSEINNDHTDDKTRYNLAKGMLGTICLSGNLQSVSSKKLSLTKEALSFYKKLENVIKFGSTTAIDDEVSDFNFSQDKATFLSRETDKQKVVYFYMHGSPALRSYDIGKCKVVDAFTNCDYSIDNGKLTVNTKEEISSLVLLLDQPGAGAT